MRSSKQSNAIPHRLPVWLLAVSIAMPLIGHPDHGMAQVETQVVRLKADNLGRDAEFIRGFVFGSMRHYHYRDMPSDLLQHVLVGRFDINGDGVKELFLKVTYPDACYPFDCGVSVLERDGGSWYHVAKANLTGVVLEESRCGYRDLQGYTSVLRWSGEWYTSVSEFITEGPCKEPLSE